MTYRSWTMPLPWSSRSLVSRLGRGRVYPALWTLVTFLLFEVPRNRSLARLLLPRFQSSLLRRYTWTPQQWTWFPSRLLLRSSNLRSSLFLQPFSENQAFSQLGTGREWTSLLKSIKWTTSSQKDEILKSTKWTSLILLSIKWTSLLKSIKWTTSSQKDEILSSSPSGRLYYVHKVDKFIKIHKMDDFIPKGWNIIKFTQWMTLLCP